MNERATNLMKYIRESIGGLYNIDSAISELTVRIDADVREERLDVSMAICELIESLNILYAVLKECENHDN